MKFKINCPHCSHSLTLADPKVGKYKPKCSSCSNPFAIVVEAGDPLKIRVGKLAASPTAPAPPSVEKVQPTSQSTTKNPTQPTNPLEVTMAHEAPQSAKLSSLATNPLEVTMAHDSQPSHIPARTTATRADLQATSFPSNELTAVKAAQAADPKAPTVMAATVDSGLQNSPNQLDATIATDGNFVTNAQTSTANSKSSVDRLGNYRIVKQLGAGGMGKVYLATQLSLDRSCAVKTIDAAWSQNPKAIARFIREAYAAAQLTHHNVVQIYDLGQDKGTNFFSMELVGGGSLDELLRAKGKLMPKLAATMILQAARGLKFAHDHGMVHRDIKPANLMLTNDGLVKVADMGLVKTAHSDESVVEDPADVQAMMLASARSQVTVVGASMGTPAYMSPEQTDDASSVDKRADVYSLGCTFYALLTGKPPFDGKTVLDVITKHRSEKLTRPEVVVAGLPSVLGDIIEKMTAKSPDDRYQDLQEVIEDLEVFLELREDLSHVSIAYSDSRDRPDNRASASANKPEEPKKNVVSVPTELAERIQLTSREFQSSPLLWLRGLAAPAWCAACGILCVLSLLLALWAGLSLLATGAQSLASSATSAVGSLAGAEATASDSSSTSSSLNTNLKKLLTRTKTGLGFALALVVGPLAAIFLAGRDHRSVIAEKYRVAFLSSGIYNKIFWGFGALLVLLIVYYLGLWIPAILGGLLGMAAGAGYDFGIARPLLKQRAKSLESAQEVLKQLRLRGLQEDQVQEAFAKHSGKSWEELFESLFGYDAMRALRVRLQPTAKANSWLGLYRDKLIDRCDVRLGEIRRASEEQLLARTEKAELVAGGMPAAEAQKQAEAKAASMVDVANETKQTMRELAAGQLTDQAAEAKRQRIKEMLKEARSGKITASQRSGRALNALLGHLLGSKFRFALAALLLLAAGIWGKANRQSLEDYWQQAKTTVSNISIDQGLEGATETAKSTLSASSKHQWNAVFGGLVTQRNVVYITLAGLVMLFGTLCDGWKISFVFIPIVLLLLMIPVFL